MKTKARCAWFAALAMVLAGCSGSGSKDDTDPNIFPTNYKQQILLTLSRTLDDPTNIREGAIGEPMLVTVAREQRYAVCMRFNARDVAQRYTGVKTNIAFFFGGNLNQLVEATPEQCGKVAYKPFPEVEKLCLAERCN